MAQGHWNLSKIGGARTYIKKTCLTKNLIMSDFQKKKILTAYKIYQNFGCAIAHLMYTPSYFAPVAGRNEQRCC